MRNKMIYMAAALLCLAACTKTKVSDLQLDGDCLVTALSLDGYEGNIDLASRSIVVRLPEVYETSAMEVTSLVISEGATCPVKQGDKLNMSSAKGLKVRNGDVSLDWTLSVLHDQARITRFVINDMYNGIIDQEAKTISVFLPGTEDVHSLVPTIEISANAAVVPASGVAQDFSAPVTFTVTNNSAQSVYTVTVTVIEKPKALFLGAASNKEDLDPEALTACNWMIANVPGTLYASFADIKNGTLDLSECKLMWWHFHRHPAVDGHDQFVDMATEALDAKNQIRAFYENGGALLMTRYATNLPSFIGATGDDDWNEHPLYKDIIMGDDPNKGLCTDAGYYITNSTAQYHIGTDWGGYDDYNVWTTRTGATIIGVGGDGAIVAWEYPAHDGKGGIICIGSGCYDWYSYTYGAGYVENYHKNIAIMTANAINYLTK